MDRKERIGIGRLAGRTVRLWCSGTTLWGPIWKRKTLWIHMSVFIGRLAKTYKNDV